MAKRSGKDRQVLVAIITGVCAIIAALITAWFASRSEPPDPPPVTIDASIAFDEVPAATGGDIGGSVTGVSLPAKNLRIVLYAKTNEWHVQPLLDEPYTSIASTGRWRSATNPGNRYAALLVDASVWTPKPQLLTLPPLGDGVIAIRETNPRSQP